MTIDLETALLIIDDLDDDLPDGAYFAMLCELTGLPIDEVVTKLAERGEGN